MLGHRKRAGNKGIVSNPVGAAAWKMRLIQSWWERDKGIEVLHRKVKVREVLCEIRTMSQHLLRVNFPFHFLVICFSATQVAMMYGHSNVTTSPAEGSWSPSPQAYNPAHLGATCLSGPVQTQDSWEAPLTSRDPAQTASPTVGTTCRRDLNKYWVKRLREKSSLASV